MSGPSLCLFGCLCLFVLGLVPFWVLRGSFFLFAFLWCLLAFQPESRYYAFSGIKRPRSLNRQKSRSQPTACTPPSRPSSAWPRSSSRTTSDGHIKHPRTFIHNHAAPRGLGQLRNERAEGERDTLRSNHVPAGITSPTPTTPSSACPSCPCLCYYRPRAVLCSCSCRSCARARAISCSCPCNLVLVLVCSCAPSRPSGGWLLRWLAASVAGRFGG